MERADSTKSQLAPWLAQNAHLGRSWKGVKDMRSNLRRGLGCIALLALVVLTVAPLASADPPPGHLVYKFNLIGYPEGQEYTGGCGNGRRIFVNRNANNAKILVTADADMPGWSIVDCNATADNQAELQADMRDEYVVMVKMLGQPGGHINICAGEYYDETTGERMCEYGELDLTRGRGKDRMRVAPRTMFDPIYEDILWTVNTNPQFRIVQFRVYEVE